MAASWAAIAAAALSAGGGVWGAQEAADAQGKGAKGGVREQRRQYNIGLNMLEPQRRLGYQALGDLSSLYGYSTPGYQPANQLLYGSGGGGNINVPGGGGGGGNSMSLFGKAPSLFPAGQTAEFLFGGGGPQPYGARIDPTAGTVDVQGAGPRKDALYTNYLRTGQWEGGKGGRGKKVRSAIDALRAGGWSYGQGGGQWEGAIPATPAGAPGNMSRFFTAPDYTFRRDEGQRDIGNTFAARGGAASGNALRALTGFNQNLAAGEYNNYVNRLMQMAGMGSAATSQGVQVGQATANNVSDLLRAQGDARASGYLGAANSLASGIDSGLNAWLFNRYLQQRGG